MRISACLVALCVSTAPAWGQAPAPAQPAAKMDLPAYVKLPANRALIAETAKNQIKLAIPACASGTFTPSGVVTVLDPPHFAEGKPYVGAWVERVDATGCGPIHVLNVLTVAHADAPPQIVGMMPGDTHTDPMMQKNALQYAQAIAARAAPPDCKQLAFIDTKFDGYTGLPSNDVTDGRENRPWREIWTATVCGTLMDIGLTFTPNARGTALTGQNPVKHSG